MSRYNNKQGGGSTPSKYSFKSSAGSSSSGEPVLSEVTPVSVERFIQSSVEHALKHCPDAVSVMKGRIGSIMAEPKVSILDSDIIANMVGTLDDEGLLLLDNQLLPEYRKELLKKANDQLNLQFKGNKSSTGSSSSGEHVQTQVKGKSNEERSEYILVEEIWPKAYSNTRETERARQRSQVRQMIQKMFYLFPSESVRSLMSNDADLNKALKSECMIGFILALKKFAVSGTGNVELNCEEAQNKLLALTMNRDLNFTEYVAKFKLAAKDLKMLNSRWPTSKIVGIFMRNLDQGRYQFNDIYTKFLDKNFPMLYQLQSGSLEEAMDAMTNHYNDVVRVAHTFTKKSASEGSNSQVYSTAKQISKAVVDEKRDTIEVSRVVLATMIKRKTTESGFAKGSESSSKKPKVADRVKAIDGSKTLRITDGSGVDLSDKKTQMKNKACFAFAKEGKCDRGDRCWFKH